MSSPAAEPSQIVADPDVAAGYRRNPALQDAFEQAAARLLAEDAFTDAQGQRRLVADLALEGGGVKGIGLVGAVLVLDEAGYSFRGVAGTSAGAIAAALIASIAKAGKPMPSLKGYLENLNFQEFMPPGSKLRQFIARHGGKGGKVLEEAGKLSHELGLYTGDYLSTWLTPILHGDLGVKTFADLKLSTDDDPDMSLPAGHEYSLVVHTSDIARARLVRLPWDYNFYGLEGDSQDVVGAVRASMSIPFFFEPVTVEAPPAVVDIPTPDGGTVTQRFAGGTVTWVDGGMLRNFPIEAFDRVDGAPPRWPTIGIRLSSLSTWYPKTEACESALDLGERCIRTMMNEWDSYSVEEDTAGRTIFVPNAGLTATEFDLTAEQQSTLFLNGVLAATNFVIETAAAGGVPKTPEAARQLVRSRRQP